MKRFRRKDTSVAMWFLNPTLHRKESWLCGEMADFKAEQKRKCKANLEPSVIPERKEFSKNDGDLSERHRSQLEGALTHQNWSNMIRKNNENKRTMVLASMGP